MGSDAASLCDHTVGCCVAIWVQARFGDVGCSGGELRSLRLHAICIVSGAATQSLHRTQNKKKTHPAHRFVPPLLELHSSPTPVWWSGDLHYPGLLPNRSPQRKSKPKSPARPCLHLQPPLFTTTGLDHLELQVALPGFGTRRIFEQLGSSSLQDLSQTSEPIHNVTGALLPTRLLAAQHFSLRKARIHASLLIGAVHPPHRRGQWYA